MCGIFGIIDRQGLRDGDAAILAKLSECIKHRGPDGASGIVTRHAGFGMRRLAVVDLGGGMQPLWNERRTIALVANGEIYNFVELRKQLELLGHRFATNSDCEVIVHLYEQYGAGCLDHLRGMFAFALIDFESRRVLIARDRLGEKPLYLVEQGDRIIFASELQALVGAGVVPFVLDDVAVRDYFLWGYVPEPTVPVAGVRKLPAGHCLEISLDDWTRRERRWWSPLDAPDVHGDPRELITSILTEIGQLTVRSDVPVGVALSGGLDSNGLASLACAHSDKKIHTFTIGYEGGGRNDESALADADAARLGTQHHRIILEDSWVVREFPRLCRVRDEPFSDLSGPSYLALVAAAREAGVPVMLFGHGADELFWGYQWPVEAVRANLRKQALVAGHAGLGAYLRLQPPPFSITGGINWAMEAGGLISGIRDRRRDLSSPLGQMVFYDQHRSWNSAKKELKQIATTDFTSRVQAVRPENLFTFSTFPERPDLAITDLLLRTYLVSNGNNQIDRLAMSEGVESRLPLIDHRLVETVIGLRRRTEDWRLPPKKWLRDAFSEQLPEQVVNRPKRGFTPPCRRWSAAIFREHGDVLDEGLLSEMGVLLPAGPTLGRFNRFSRFSTVAMPALMLEMWARGMRDLERSWPSTRIDHRNLPEWTQTVPDPV